MSKRIRGRLTKFSLNILVVFLSGVFLFTGCVNNGTGSTPILHQDPTGVDTEYDLVSVLSAYTGILDLISAGSYDEVASGLNDLKAANADSEFFVLLERFSELSQELADSLEQVDSLLDQAGNDLAMNDLVTASGHLDIADSQLINIGALSKELQSTDNLIGELLNITSLAASNPVRQAFDGLLSATERIQQATDRLEQLRLELNTLRLGAQAELIETVCTLNISPDDAFVGDIFKINGQLSARETTLGGRTVSINVGGLSYTVTTTIDGTYTASLPVPYRYQDSISILARYLPQGADVSLYQAASSQPVELNLNYYRTYLENLNAPTALYPGMAVEITGQVTSDGPQKQHIIRVSLNGQLLAQTSSAAGFNMMVTPPANHSNIGPATLTITVLADQRYAGVASGIQLPIELLPLQAELSAPDYVIIPGLVTLKGNITGGKNDLADSQIIVTYPHGDRTLSSNADSSFSTSLDFPLNFTFFGTQRISAVISPAQPWYAPLETGVDIIIINPVIIGTLILITAALGLYSISRSGNKTKRKARINPNQATPVEIPVPGLQVPPVFVGAAHGIVLAYVTARQVVMTLSGRNILPHHTVREYVDIAAGRKFFSSAFLELSLLIEIVLYSRLEPGQANLLQSGRLLREIQENKKHVSS